MLPDIPLLKFTKGNNFFLIAGPCVVENEVVPFLVAEKIVQVANKYKIPLIFKASYKKANRSKIESFTGIGDIEALKIIEKIGFEFNIPTLTDIHSEAEAVVAAEYVDELQIPAFLCRQTELLAAAAYTGKAVNIKKGQFLSPESMKFAVDKVKQAGNDNIILTERGTMFGYQDLVVDYRGIVEMKKNNVPVVLDITHSLQQPNQASGVSGGRPDLIETIAKAGVAAGVDGIFIETHPDPENAKSDGSNMLHLDLFESLIEKLVKIRKATL